MELWRLVGEALLVGRREHKSDKLFGQWCVAQGLDMHRNYRSAAMWLATEWASAASITCTISDPIQLRKEVSALAGTPAPSPEVDLASVPAPRPRISIDTAKKVNKLAAMAERGEG